MPEGSDKLMTCQALETHQKGVQAVDELHTAMSHASGTESGSSFETKNSSDFTMTGSLQLL